MRTPRRKFLSQLTRALTAGLASLLGLGVLGSVLRQNKRPGTLASGEPEVTSQP